VNNEGDEDVFGFATILPIDEELKVMILMFLLICFFFYYSFSILIQNSLVLKALLDKAAGNQEILSHFKDDCSSGFMIHGRFSNFPPQLIVDLHRNLKEDLLWATSISKKECEEGKDLEVDVIEKFKKLKKILLLSPCSFSNDHVKTSSSSSAKSQSQSQSHFSNVIGNLVRFFHLLS
jgi:hypothetical protein